MAQIDRQRHPGPGADRPAIAAISHRGGGPEPRLPRARGLPQMRRGRPAARTPEDRRHPRRAAGGRRHSVHRENADWFRFGGWVRWNCSLCLPAIPLTS